MPNRATKGELLAGLVSETASGANIRVKKLSITSDPDGTEQDTGWNLPTKGLVLDVIVDVTTAEASVGSKTLDVGLLTSEGGGDPDGFLDGVSVAATGGVAGNFTMTDGTSQNYVSANTLGALMFTGLVGADAADEAGVVAKTPHVLNGTARSVTYTSSRAFSDLRADIYVVYASFSNDEG